MSLTRHKCRRRPCSPWLLFWISCALTFFYHWTHSVSPAPGHWDDPCAKIESLQDIDPQLVACLKKEFLSPPSQEPYNLTKPEIENPTQYGQNIVALKLLNFKRNGFFIECGALDGEQISNTLYLERNFGWTGLLIEADPNLYKVMETKHRKAWTSDACLSPSTTAQKLTMLEVDFGIYGVGITLTNYTEKLKKFNGFPKSKKVQIEIQCFPLYTYLLALNLTEVDYFSLDIEGADFQVLQTIPFDKIIFKVLEIEVHWVKEGKQAVKTFLEGHGYIFVMEMNVDYIFIHNSTELRKGLVI